MDWTTPEGLRRLKEMAERATSGPWMISDDGCLWMGNTRYRQPGERRLSDMIFLIDDAEFIAVAREALPQLILALEKERGGR